MSAAFALPPVMDLRAAAPLKEALQSRRGAPLDLDAAQVERVGGLCLQILLAAAAQWRTDGHVLRIVNASDAFAADMRRMGAQLSEGSAA